MQLLRFRHLPSLRPNAPLCNLRASLARRNIHSQSQSSLRRSYLYVPASSDRMLAKSLTMDVSPDIFIYDLEDSVPPSAHDKNSARKRLCDFLDHVPAEQAPSPERVAVRVNGINTPFFENDVAEVLKCPMVRTLVLPKVNSAQALHHVSRTVRKYAASPVPLHVVASIESARAVWNLKEIASWESDFGAQQGGKLMALLFASEDYCADTSVIRTASRQELLFVRSQIVVTAKASGLDAIDMVCINYKDPGYLRDECEDGRRLGFTGKQAIHPAQVETVNTTFVPTTQEILRAARILHQMDEAHAVEKGAFGLEMEGGGKEMIDMPMLKQAENTLRVAKAAGLHLPIL